MPLFCGILQRGLVGVLCLAFAGSCSLIMGDDEPQLPDSEDQEVVFTGPKTFEEEFPFVRFLERDDDLLSAVLTVPKDSGDSFKTQLEYMLPYLKPGPDGPEGQKAPPPRASITVFKDGGQVFNNDLEVANQKPWKSVGQFRPVEDLLQVTGSEEDLREIFEALDVWFNSGPQISIEATVYENLNNDSFERGMTQLGSTPLFEDVQGQAFLRSFGASFPATSNPTLAGGGLGGAFQVGLIDSSFQLDAVLQFLQQKGLVHVISEPKIVTRNGVTANVESTEEIPFLNVTGVNFSGAATFNVANKSVGVKMNVTPFLVGVDTIHLVIDVEVSRLGQNFVIGTDGNNQQILAPSLNTRKAKTEVYVRNGTTVIIGGLALTEQRESESKVPILGDLPLIGWFFSSRSTEEVETQVTFMFTPKIKDRPSIDRFGVGDFFDPFEAAEESE